ncbi:MAG: 50S ribosomal protein L1 [Conexivisphaerales archaeon]
MVDKQILLELVKKARENTPKRNFKQAFELYAILDSHRIKPTDVNINEVVTLPSKPKSQATVAVIASGDLGLRAKRAGSDNVITIDELDRLSTNKKDSKKLAKQYDFFVAETSAMPKVGKSLGPFLGPKGKMPVPITQTSPIEQMIERLKGSTRIRARAHNGISCKIGEEDMSDEEIVANALAALEAIERKLPNGLKAVKSLGIKLSMGPLQKVNLVE